VAQPPAPPESERPEGFLLPAEIAERAGISRHTVYWWVRRGVVKKKDIRVVRHKLTKKVLWVWIRESAVAATFKPAP
jgi:predicted site-specific integrase-resolvase